MKKEKIILGSIGVVLLAAVALILATLLGKSKPISSGEDYEYESSLRQFETIEDILLDGKKDDSKWQKINPYVRKTATENRDMSKYEVYEGQMEECNAEVYTYLGEEGLFIYAVTDDPIVNVTTLSPLATTAFDFYISSQDSLTRLDNLFNFAVSAQGNMKLRVRSIDSTTGKEAWVSRPCIGIKTYASINEKGYSVEAFIPWSTMNMEKPEYLQMATALSRRIDETYEAARTWEMFDFYTGPINMTNSATFPLFDENGYVEFVAGDNFGLVHNNLIDLSEDKGANPKVTTLNRRTVTAFLNKEAVKDVYWETTVKIDDFNYTDDPRVGIILRGEKAEDGSYDQVYLLFQLDKEHKGDGYTIKNLIMLPSTNKANTWTDSQWYNLNSHIKSKEFKLAVLKQGATFSFYLDDVLLAVRDNIGSFKVDSKVTCGITSWYTGATFTKYQMATSGLDSIRAKKTDGFVADEHYTAINIDTLSQKDGYIWGRSTVTNQSTVNFNQSVKDTFTASIKVSDLSSYKDAKDSRQGIMLTKDLGNGKYRRMFISLTGGENDSFDHVQAYVFENDDLGENWKNVKSALNVKMNAQKEAELTVSVSDNYAYVTLDGKFMSAISLAEFGMQTPVTVGLSSWKGTAKFSNISLKAERVGTDKITTSKGSSKTVMPLTTEDSTDVYAETWVKPIKTSTDMWPRAGLRLTNKDGNNIDFVLAFDKENKLLNVIAVPVDAKNADYGTRQTYKIDSVLKSTYETGIKLEVLKKGNTIYFFANDELLGKETYEGFSTKDKVTASLYAKGAECEFTAYRAVTGDKVPTLVADTTIPLTKKNISGWTWNRKYDEKANTIIVKPAEADITKSNQALQLHEKSAADMYTETMVKVPAVYNKVNWPYVGLRLTNDEGKSVNVFLAFDNTEKPDTPKYYGFEYQIDGNDKSKVTLSGAELTAEQIAKGVKVAVLKRDDMLYFLLNDELKGAAALEEFGADDKVTAHLYSKYTNTSFSDYAVKVGDVCPTVVCDAEGIPLTADNLTKWSWEGSYNKTKNELVIKVSDTDKARGLQLLTLTAEKTADAYIETTVKVSGVKDGINNPHIGLRMTNEAGQSINFFLNYDKAEVKNARALHIAEDGTESVSQVYGINSILNEVSEDGIKLAMAKVGNTFYFYVNDVLQATKTYDDFGEDVKVDASLYSKHTESTLSDYGVLTAKADIEEKVKDFADLFVADTKKTTSRFDLLKEEANEAEVKVYETAWYGSIVNWKDVSADKFYVETDITINEVSAVTGAGGIVISDGINRFIVTLSKENQNNLKFVTMTKENFDNYKAGSNEDGKREIIIGTVAVKETNKLALYRNGNQLIVLVNDVVRKVFDLSDANTVKYPITGATTVGLYGMKATVTFTNYDVKAGNESSALEILANAPTTDANLKNWVWNAAYDETANRITIDIADSDKAKGTQLLTLIGAKAADVYAETTVKVSELKDGVGWPRAGIRLSNGTQYIDFVLNYHNPELLNAMALHVEGSQESLNQYYAMSDTVKATAATTGIKLAVAKIDDVFYFLVNDALQGSMTYANFGADVKVDASLYSKHTVSTYTNYSVKTGTDVPTVKILGETKSLTGWNATGTYDVNHNVIHVETITSDKTKGTCTIPLNKTASKDIYVETVVAKSDIDTSVWPRTGLRLTNETANKTVELFLAYNKDTQAFTGVGVDGIGTHEFRMNSILSADTTGIKLAIAKKGDTLYFYVNDVLQAQRKGVEGFGAEDVVTAKLYSKNTTSKYTDFSVATTDVENIIASYPDQFVIHEEKVKSYFELSQEEAPTKQVLLDEKDWNGSIVNWNRVSSEKLYVETKIQITGSNSGDNAYAGLVLTDSNNNKLYAMLYGNANGITYLDCYTMAEDNFNNKEVVYEYMCPSALQGTVKLALHRDGNQLSVLLNDTVMNVIDLSQVANKITGATTVGLTGWKAKATFTQYNVSEYIESEQVYGTDVVTLNREAMTDIYVKTVVKTSDAMNDKWARVGLRLQNSDGEKVDFVLIYNNKVLQKNTMAVNVGSDEKDTSVQKVSYALDDSLFEDAKTKGIELAVRKTGNVFYFYVNDVLQGTNTYSGFDADTAVTAKLYSKHTDSSFWDYSCSKVVNLTSTSDSVVANVLEETSLSDVYVETIVKVESCITSAWPVVGLRLTTDNASASISGANVKNADFVLTFTKNTTPTFSSLSLMPTKSNNGEISANRKNVTLTSEMKAAITGEGLRIGIGKKGGTLYLFVDGQQMATHTYSGFGANDKVTVSLISKGTTTLFWDYSCSTTLPTLQ